LVRGRFNWQEGFGAFSFTLGALRVAWFDALKSLVKLRRRLVFPYLIQIN
jgi:hypothetical protein